MIPLKGTAFLFELHCFAAHCTGQSEICTVAVTQCPVMLHGVLYAVEGGCICTEQSVCCQFVGAVLRTEEAMTD